MDFKNDENWWYGKNSIKLFSKFHLSDQNCGNKSIFCVFENNFLEKSKIPILVSDSAHKYLLIIPSKPKLGKLQYVYFSFQFSKMLLKFNNSIF